MVEILIDYPAKVAKESSLLCCRVIGYVSEPDNVLDLNGISRTFSNDPLASLIPLSCLSTFSCGLFFFFVENPFPIHLAQDNDFIHLHPRGKSIKHWINGGTATNIASNCPYVGAKCSFTLLKPSSRATIQSAEG